jgi:hypothetical protein
MAVGMTQLGPNCVTPNDKNENWYTGTGTPASNQYDAWSVITHEFGHALGLRDTQSIYCPGNATDATMCGQIFRGTT